jgi:exopolysaccharide biosynthesis polyprenyl glycosylphosphotransferase
MTELRAEDPGTQVMPVLPGQRRSPRAAARRQGRLTGFARFDSPVLAPSRAPAHQHERVTLDRPAPVEISPAARPRSRRHERMLVVLLDMSVGIPVALIDWRLGLAAGLGAAVSTALVGLHRCRFSLSVLDEAPRLLRASAWVTLMLGVMALAAGISLTAAVAGAALSALALVIARAAAYSRLRWLRRCGVTVFPTVLAGQDAREIAVRIADHPETGLRVIGTVDATGRVTLMEGGTALVGTVIEQYRVSDIVVDPSGSAHETAQWIRRLAWKDLHVHLVLPQMGATPVRAWDDHIWGLPLLRMRSSMRWRRGRAWKRLTDVVVAGLGIVVLAPLLGLVAVLVRREIGPGVIFRQERVGLDGRIFEVLKFRSMRPPTTGEFSPWSVSNSDRIGPTGRFIRKYSVDELPQLWNVLRGEMSLVGPRPERPEYVRQFSQTYPHYGARHRAPAGLTGWAAVEGLRGDTSIEHRAYFDNLYVDSWSYWSDLKILARTVLSVFRGTGC